MVRRFLIAVAVGMLILAAPTPAQAIGVTWDRGQPTTCATGGISGFTPVSTDGLLILHEWLDACLAHLPTGAQWGVVRYTTRSATEGVLASYPGPAAFTAASYLHGDPAAGAGWGNLTAVCLAAGPTDRLACLSVTPAGGGEGAFAAIPVNDPRVLVPYVVQAGSDDDGHPCFTCV
jgi:hypothetical protein